MKDEIYKMLKYSLIGVLNTFIHWVVFFFYIRLNLNNICVIFQGSVVQLFFLIS